MYQLSFFFLILILFSGCSSQQMQNSVQVKKTETIEVSQDPKEYLKNFHFNDQKKISNYNKEYTQRYFRPWHMKKLSASKKEAMWGFAYANRETFGHNYQRITQSWYDSTKENANFQRYNTLKRKAITIKNADIRVLPNHQPIFLDPSQAGEGFPFDYNQISSVYINTPLIVSHFSKDKAWVFVECNFATGWLPVDSIAFVDKKTQKKFETGHYGIAQKDNFPIYEKDWFIEKIKLGTIFPIYKGELLYIKRSSGLKGKIGFTQSSFVTQKPLPFTKENISDAIQELINEPYGWGGLHGTRDCSSMTRDFFSLYGVYLERNSKGQTFNGKYISIEDLSLHEKKKKILKEAKPFLTLLYAKGHVMLYVGAINNEPIIFHQFWGIATKDKQGKEGREIIGKTLFSTLEIGNKLENYDKDAALINKIKGIVLLDTAP